MKRSTFFMILTAAFIAAGPTMLGAQTSTLSDVEKAGIILMREEEKLARDVYLELYDTWKIPVFANIASSEQTHMNAVETLIDRYGLLDPIASDARGVFTNPELSNLYTELSTLGKKDAASAITVGAKIEELDIVDLMRLLGETKNPDIITVYENLLRGSRNHLRSFSAQLSRYTQF